MKKLKLEDLEVTSFDTLPTDSEERGTVNGHAPPPSYYVTCPTNPELDCTYGCSHITGCPFGCVLFTEDRDCE